MEEGNPVWDQILALPIGSWCVCVGGQPAVEEDKKVKFSIDTSLANSGVPDIVRLSPGGTVIPHAETDDPEFTQDEQVDLSPTTPSGHPSFDVPGHVLETFDAGFCYLGGIAPTARNRVRSSFGQLPTVATLLTVPAELRNVTVGVFSRTHSNPTIYHVSFETVGDSFWPEIERLCLEDPTIKIGLTEEDVGEIPDSFFENDDYQGEDWRVDPNRDYRMPRYFSVLLRSFLPIVFLMFILRGIMFDFIQFSLFVTFLLLSLLSAVYFESLRSTWTRCVTRFFPRFASEPVYFFSQTATLLAQGNYNMVFLYHVGTALRLTALALSYWKLLTGTVSYLQTFSMATWRFVCFLFESLDQLLTKRTYQSGCHEGFPWLKNLFSLVSAVLRFVSSIVEDISMSRKLNNLARDFQTVSHATDIPRVARNFAEQVKDASSPVVVESLDEDFSDFALPPEDLDERVPQAGDGLPDNCCKHLLTKGNISNVASILAGCPRGNVHVITAATGVGKSTVCPYELSLSTSKDVYVAIPTIAATRSSAQVIRDRFGVQVHIHADSEYTPGSCNIHLMTSKSFVGTLLHNPQKILAAGAVIFDEMHVPSGENWLFRKISHILAQTSTVVWCSATFSQSFTLPGDLSHPVEERIDKSVTIDKVFTPACKVRGVSPSTIRGRYIVFCASVRDTQRVVRRFAGSGIPAFAISSSNYATEMPKVEKALRDRSISTVIVAATPCLETGLTLPFNYCVDFREQIVPKMNYDPVSLSTKRAPVTKGMATQRKGRVGRLFRGIYIAPPVNFTSPDHISESDLSIAVIYARLFGFPSPSSRISEILASRVLTDCFLDNVFATRMDPLAVHGMTTPEGRIFKSFETFEFPSGAKKSAMKFSPEYFPQNLWRTWPRFETERWTQVDKRTGDVITGDSVRAPYWDYTVDSKVQIDNCNLRFFVTLTLTLKMVAIMILIT